MNFLKVVKLGDHTLKGLQLIELQSFGVTQTFLMLHVFQNSSGTLHYYIFMSLHYYIFKTLHITPISEKKSC